MIHPTYQWSNQIPPNVSSRLYILFIPKRRHDTEVRYSLSHFKPDQNLKTFKTETKTHVSNSSKSSRGLTAFILEII